MSLITSRRAAKVGPALLTLLFAAAVPSTAFGQATRTWVSGVGDDANPCSRTAPCKTFAGAISKTAAKGEINVLDPGGFGGVTITKSITIDASPFEGGVLVSGTNAIIINAGASDRVTLRGLDLEGVGTGLDGVRILVAGVVRVEDTRISDFTGDGIDMNASNNKARLVVDDTTIENNAGTGVLVHPTLGGITNRATLRRTNVDDNGNGVVADGSLGRAAVNTYRTSIADNGTLSGTGIGIRATGANGVHRISQDEVSGNLIGLQADAGGQIISFGDNDISGNNADGAPTSTTPRL